MADGGSRLAQALRSLGGPLLLAAEAAQASAAAAAGQRVLPLERDGLAFAPPPGTPPGAALALKHALQHHLDLAAREAEVQRMSELFGDRLVALLHALGGQQLDETGLARMFDFLGEGAAWAVRRQGTLLVNRGLDPHTLHVGQRRAATIRVHACAMGSGELFTCRTEAYEGYFLRDQPFAAIERALIELHLHLLSTQLRQQALHQSIARLNEAFAREFQGELASTGPARLDGAVESVERNFNRLLGAALKDSLTQAYNRHKTSDLLEQLCARDGRFAVVLFDIDHFKRINDRHGHLAGDRILVEVARRAGACLRGGDLLARWGGEEFLVIARTSDATAAAVLAERLRIAICGQPVALDDQGGADVTASASFGVAERRGGEPAEALLDRADEALYAAKAGGRNRVCLG